MDFDLIVHNTGEPICGWPVIVSVDLDCRDNSRMNNTNITRNAPKKTLI